MQRCVTLPLPDVLRWLEQDLDLGPGGLDVWLWDYQRRRLASVTTGAAASRGQLIRRRGGARNRVAPIIVLGCELGLLVADRPLGPGPLTDVAAGLGLALRAQEAVIDRIPMARRQGRELSLAAELQWSLLAPVPLRLGQWTVSAALEPAFDCGGDAYEVSLSRGRLHVAVLDAVGHGLRSAQISAVALSALRQGRRDGEDLHRLAQRIDEAVAASVRVGFVTGLLLEIDPGDGTVRWLSAGHPPPLHQRHDGAELVELNLIPGLPFGLRLGSEPVERPVQAFRLAPGESLVIYSDGVLENVALDTMTSLGRPRFEEILTGVLLPGGPSDPARAVSNLLLTATGPSFRDDATVAVVQHQR